METNLIRRVNSCILKLDREKCINLLSSEFHESDKEVLALYLEHYVIIYVLRLPYSPDAFSEVNSHWKTVILPIENKISQSIVLTVNQVKKLEDLFSIQIDPGVLAKLNSELEMSRYKLNVFQKAKTRPTGTLSNAVYPCFVPFLDLETEL